MLSPLLLIGAIGGGLGAIEARDWALRAIALTVLIVAIASLAFPALVYARLFRRRLVVERQITRAERCAACGYNMEGLLQPVCPECGWRPSDAEGPE